MTSHRFTVPGNPVPKARPRVANGHAYTPLATLEAEGLVQLAARKAGVRPLLGPVRLSLFFARGDLRRCDLDNLAKLVQDALNGIAYEDDSQIVELQATKVLDREKPRTEVVVSEVERV